MERRRITPPKKSMKKQVGYLTQSYAHLGDSLSGGKTPNNTVSGLMGGKWRLEEALLFSGAFFFVVRNHWFCVEGSSRGGAARRLVDGPGMENPLMEGPFFKTRPLAQAI